MQEASCSFRRGAACVNIAFSPSPAGGFDRLITRLPDADRDDEGLPEDAPRSGRIFRKAFIVAVGIRKPCDEPVEPSGGRGRKSDVNTRRTTPEAATGLLHRCIRARAGKERWRRNTRR